MRNIKIAALQFSCCSQVQENIDKAETMVREAASNGANLILLPELFERPYFCQEKRYDYYDYALPLTENPAVRRFQAVAGELGVVIPVSFYERDVQRLFNSIAMIDADGSILGVYRKTHIPDDHFYQEKFYFTPGDTGFKVFETRFGTVGVGICWDQWFPESARGMALMGAEALLYPTAIGSEPPPALPVNSREHWQRTQQGHAAANVMPLIASNRYGIERSLQDPEGLWIRFHGSSFIADPTGAKVAEAGEEGDAVLTATFDLAEIEQLRNNWFVFRDRRPELYGPITTLDGSARPPT